MWLRPESLPVRSSSVPGSRRHRGSQICGRRLREDEVRARSERAGPLLTVPEPASADEVDGLGWTPARCSSALPTPPCATTSRRWPQLSAATVSTARRTRVRNSDTLSPPGAFPVVRRAPGQRCSTSSQANRPTRQWGSSCSKVFGRFGEQLARCVTRQNPDSRVALKDPIRAAARKGAFTGLPPAADPPQPAVSIVAAQA